MLFLILGHLLQVVTSAESCAGVFHENLCAILPKNYNKHKLPDNNGRALEVAVRLEVMDLDNIQEETMDFSLHAQLKEEWMDPALNLTKFIGKELQFIPDDISDYFWKPDIVFHNCKNGELLSLPIPNRVIYVHPNGKLGRVSVYQLLVSCAMDLHQYPMDTQLCFLTITSLKYSASQMNISWGNLSEPNGTEGLIFLKGNIEPIKHLIADKNTTLRHHEWNNKKYTYLNANFKLVRHVSSHLLNVYLPSSLVVILSFISPWLDYQAVAGRVALGLTSMLTISTQVVQTRSGLPPINYMTALDIWLFTCIFMIFLSLLEFALVYHLSFQASTKIKNISENDGKKCSCGSRAKQMLPFSFKWEPGMIDRISRYAFPLSFFIFAAIYWSIFLSIQL